MTAMVGRARQNRRVRAAGVSVVAVVAVVGVALGGAAAVRLGDPAPVPPAETVSPSPTTPVAGLTCGVAIADLALFDDAPVTIEALLDDAAVAPGEPLTTRVTVAAVHPPGGDVGEDSLTLLTFAAVRDGVVVGLGLGTVDPGSTQGLSGRSGVTALSTIDLATCGEDGEAVSPLDVGGYQLYAGLTASFAGSGGEQRMLLGGPWPFTVTEAADPGPEQTEPTGPPALEDLVISTSGLGPLRLGYPLPVDPAPTDLIRWDDQACAGTDLPGRWVAAYPEAAGMNGMPFPPFAVRVFEDRVARIDILTAGPRNTAGIGVLSPLAELQAAHPDAVLVSAANDSGQPVDAWAIQDGERSLVFEVAANADGSDLWEPGQVGHVVAMVALSGIPYDYPAWGSDTCG